MKNYSVFAALIIASTLTVSGCKSSQPAAPASAPGQSAAPAPGQPAAPAPAGTLNSDGTTNPPGQQPSPQQAPAPGSAMMAGPAMMQAAPAAAPPLVAPVGTRVLIRTTEQLSASHNEVGDTFTGVLDSPVVAHGATLFARGTRVSGTVIAAKGRGRFKGAGALGIELNTIAGLHVQTNEYEREVSGKGKRTGALIGGGAGLGAIIGGLAGGGKGAVIGGLAGGGAGTAGAAYTGNKDVIIPSESPVTFHLTAPLTVKH